MSHKWLLVPLLEQENKAWYKIVDGSLVVGKYGEDQNIEEAYHRHCPEAEQCTCGLL
jgi:hypothetical protein